MADKDDDLFGKDEDEEFDDFDRLMDTLLERVMEFADEEGVANDGLPLLLIRTSLTMTMMNYVMSVRKPSGGGLKLELDRFRRDVDEMFRDMKKAADLLVAKTKMAIAMTAEDLDEDET
jgi:hypothetical protein